MRNKCNLVTHIIEDKLTQTVDLENEVNDT